MGIIADTYLDANGDPKNGLNVKLWPYSNAAFPAGWPAQDDALPGAGYQQGATIVTGVAYGGAGAFAFPNTPDGDWIVSVEDGLAIIYKGYSIATANNTIMEFVKMRTGHYYGPTGARTIALTYSAFALDFLYAVPFLLDEDTTFDRLGIYGGVAGAGNKHFRLGIYDDLNGIPNSLIHGTAELTNINTTFITEIINEALARGRYWLAILTNDSVTSFAQATSFLSIAKLTTGAATAYPEMDGAFKATQAYGALPATFPAIDQDSSPLVPWIQLRKA